VSSLVMFRSFYAYSENLELASPLTLECHEIQAWHR